MNLKVNVLSMFLSGVMASSVLAQTTMTASDALALLSESNHLSDPLKSILSEMAANNNKSGKTKQLYAQQLIAIQYISDNKITKDIPSLILYLNYWGSPDAMPIYDLGHGEDLENVKKNWPALGALVKMPESAPILKDYCLDEKNPLGYRLATLHVLKYVDHQAFEDCRVIFKEKYTKLQEYLDYLDTKHAQYTGIPDFK